MTSTTSATAPPRRTTPCSPGCLHPTCAALHRQLDAGFRVAAENLSEVVDGYRDLIVAQNALRDATIEWQRYGEDTLSFMGTGDAYERVADARRSVDRAIARLRALGEIVSV